MADAAPAPQAIDGPPRRQRIVLLAIVAAITLALDLWTKAWAWSHLRPDPLAKPRVQVIEHWAYYDWGFNTGSAFSFLRDSPFARPLFIIVTIAALLYMVKLARTLPTRWPSAYVAIALVSGGALGNLHDRLLRQHDSGDGGGLEYGVVDFIQVYYWQGARPWPTFNVADVALVFGVGLLFIFLTRHGDAIDGAKAVAPAASPEAAPAPVADA
jgi:signal peptidase II